MMQKLTLRNIEKSFDGTRVIENFSLEITEGEFVVLLGPSGCGKSTLLRIISGLESPDSGSVLIENSDVTEVEPRRRDVAMVFQNYALYPHMTVYQNIAFPLRMAKLPKAEIRSRVEHAADLLGLAPMLERKPRTLSGGQRQRVALGRALVREPKLFLFDEPLSNLDAKLRVTMRTEIQKLMRKLDATVVYVTHDQEEALTLGDRIVLLDDGVIQQIGSPKQIYDDPDSTFVALFIGSPRMNLLEGCSIDVNVASIPEYGEVTLDMPLEIQEETVTIGFRPQECTVDGDGDLSMTVTATEYVGSSRFIYGTLGSTDVIISTGPQNNAQVGEKVAFSVPRSSIRLFDKVGKRLR